MSEAPRFDLPEGIFLKHPANTALVHHGGRLLALMEATVPHAVRAATLETVGAYDFPGWLLYTSDAGDERTSVDLGGGRIFKKKQKTKET